MLKSIVNHSVKLVSFLLAIELALYQPQMLHVKLLVDALLVCDTRKTLCNLYRRYVDEPDGKTAADFFRESPWEAEDLSKPRRDFMLAQLLSGGKMLGIKTPIFISIDDNLGKKHKDTQHLEAVDWQYNHTESTPKKPVYNNGYVYVETHVRWGLLGFTFDTQLYLRESTVRKLNRQRGPEERLKYRSKYRIARAMLVEFARLLPEGYPVYVLFDSWYASAKLIKFCRRQGWHVICGLKSNRKLNGKPVKQHDQALKHKHYLPVRKSAVGSDQPPSYYVRKVNGHLEEISFEAYVIISRRHPGDRHPKYFLCTDLSLAPQEALRYYERRWPVEVDNTYLKTALGLGDFRLQGFEATQKWFAVVLLAINYLQYRQMQVYLQTGQLLPLADLIRQHREEHAEDVLRTLAKEVLRTGQVETVLKRFIVQDSRAMT